MAQTKRKRRSKHRGNAAGNIEARGRTGRKPTAAEARGGKRSAAADRRFAEPTWGGAAMRAAFAAVLLFVLFSFGLTGQKQSLGTAFALSAIAFVIYVPLGYKIDHFFWRRRMAKFGRALPEKGKPQGGKR
jgi:hypothetical protein